MPYILYPFLARLSTDRTVSILSCLGYIFMDIYQGNFPNFVKKHRLLFFYIFFTKNTLFFIWFML